MVVLVEVGYVGEWIIEGDIYVEQLSDYNSLGSLDRWFIVIVGELLLLLMEE